MRRSNRVVVVLYERSCHINQSRSIRFFRKYCPNKCNTRIWTSTGTLLEPQPRRWGAENRAYERVLCAVFYGILYSWQAAAYCMTACVCSSGPRRPLRAYFQATLWNHIPPNQGNLIANFPPPKICTLSSIDLLPLCKKTHLNCRGWNCICLFFLLRKAKNAASKADKLLLEGKLHEAV